MTSRWPRARAIGTNYMDRVYWFTVFPTASAVSAISVISAVSLLLTVLAPHLLFLELLLVSPMLDFVRWPAYFF